MERKGIKVAVVTGGAQGIGKGIASLLAARGFRVVAADHDTQAGRDLDAGARELLVAYLISEEAGFVTGQNFVIGGGMTRKMVYV